MMHAAKVENSKPLQLILGLLLSRGEHGATTLEIAEYASVQSASTWVSALRKNGHQVKCDYEGLSANHRKVHRYRLIG